MHIFRSTFWTSTEDSLSSQSLNAKSFGLSALSESMELKLNITNCEYLYSKMGGSPHWGLFWVSNQIGAIAGFWLLLRNDTWSYSFSHSCVSSFLDILLDGSSNFELLTTYAKDCCFFLLEFFFFTQTKKLIYNENLPFVFDFRIGNWLSWDKFNDFLWQ